MGKVIFRQEREIDNGTLGRMSAEYHAEDGTTAAEVANSLDRVHIVLDAWQTRYAEYAKVQDARLNMERLLQHVAVSGSGGETNAMMKHLLSIIGEGEEADKLLARYEEAKGIFSDTVAKSGEVHGLAPDQVDHEQHMHYRRRKG